MMSQLDIMWSAVGLTGIIWCMAECIRFWRGSEDKPGKYERTGALPFTVRAVEPNEAWLATFSADGVVMHGKIIDGNIVWSRPTYAEKPAVHIKQLIKPL